MRVVLGRCLHMVDALVEREACCVAERALVAMLVQMLVVVLVLNLIGCETRFVAVVADH